MAAIWPDDTLPAESDARQMMMLAIGGALLIAGHWLLKMRIKMGRR